MMSVHMSTSDSNHSGRPAEATILENFNILHDLGMGDRRLMVRDIDTILGISSKRVHHIDHHLNMKKGMWNSWSSDGSEAFKGIFTAGE